MIFHWSIALCLVGAYLLGSIPTSVWIGKMFYGIDIRQHGSGNAGATNALRTLGVRTGVIVLLIDVVKGSAAVALAWVVSERFTDPELFSAFQLLLGLFALLGHIFPVFAGFRGGKGVATLTGVVAVLFPIAFPICLAIFVVIFVLTRYVSLGSILASIALPLVVIAIIGQATTAEIVFSCLVAVMVPLSHRKNIQRLLNGTENKTTFSKK
ncbi:MAG TPA: glycerol-3-phosphate 1-O-acyltransferase PlsY [Bacteroidales bacterium]|nr:glycerol-3-phosphate 1-O-acyltransferase PlsY [Bacteroidales bacterium]